MAFAILPALQWLGAGFWSFASSRAGQIIIAAVVAWFWAGARADDHWRAVIAADKAAVEAAYRAEVARQEQAAREIAAAATARAEDDAALERDLRAQIDAFNDRELIHENTVTAEMGKFGQNPHKDRALVGRNCLIDDAFADRVRRLDAVAHRPAKPARRAR